MDFSGNPNLVEVYLNNNQIEEIDVSCLPVLQWLGVKNNRLTELNVEVNYNLAALWCDRNELNLLLLPNPDVHVYGKKDGEQQESRLARLECGDNALPALHLSMQPELKELSCEGNSLTALDLAGNENLGLLDCDDGVAITLPEGVTFCAQMTVNGDEKTYQCTSLAAAIDKITGKDGVTGPEEVQSACITVFENLEGPALVFAADQQKTVVIDLDGHTYWAWDDPALVAYDNDVTVINGEIVYRPRPAFRTQSLVLSGQIGVTFFLELPEIDGADYTESYMTFSVPNGTVTARDDFDPEAMNANKTYYGFTCYLNTIQMAEPITATFHYPVNGEEKTIEKIYAAKDYFEAYDNNKELFDEKTQAVIESLADYGHYMQAYLKEVKMLDCTDMDKYYTEAYIFSEIEELLNDHPVQYEPNGANIAKISFSTVLDSQTSIRLVLTPTSGYTGTVTAETTDGTPVTVTGTGKRYIVDIPDIPAHKLSTAYTINLATDGGTATICASALSYAKMMMDSSEEAIVRNAASAFFAYSAAADAYRRSH